MIHVCNVLNNKLFKVTKVIQFIQTLEKKEIHLIKH